MRPNNHSLETIYLNTIYTKYLSPFEIKVITQHKKFRKTYTMCQISRVYTILRETYTMSHIKSRSIYNAHGKRTKCPIGTKKHTQYSSKHTQCSNLIAQIFYKEKKRALLKHPLADPLGGKGRHKMSEGVLLFILCVHYQSAPLYTEKNKQKIFWWNLR